MGFLCWSLYFSKMKAVYGLYFLQMGVRIESVFQNDQSVYTSGSTGSGYKLKIPLTLLLILQTDINCKNMGWKQANSSWKMGERQAIWRKVAILNRSFQKSYNLPFQIFFHPNFPPLIIDKRSEIINMIFTISVSHPTLPFQVLAWLFFCFFI